MSDKMSAQTWGCRAGKRIARTDAQPLRVMEIRSRVLPPPSRFRRATTGCPHQQQARKTSSRTSHPLPTQWTWTRGLFLQAGFNAQVGAQLLALATCTAAVSAVRSTTQARRTPRSIEPVMRKVAKRPCSRPSSWRHGTRHSCRASPPRWPPSCPRVALGQWTTARRTASSSTHRARCCLTRRMNFQ